MPRPRTPDVCRRCTSALTDVNWAPGNRARHSKLCRACDTAQTRARQKAKPEYYREASKASLEKLRHEILLAYGHQCVCCGEVEEAFLTLDHTQNDGAAHRRSFHGTQRTSAYVWREARRLGFPRDRFQLLCWNCNWAKHARGICPHQTHEVKEAI